LIPFVSTRFIAGFPGRSPKLRGDRGGYLPG
jgi:hypothetical protein